MNELLEVKIENDQQLISARDLYKGLEIKARFSLWVSQNFSDFEEGQDFTSVFTNTVVNNGATRTLQDYLLTIDMGKQLCLMSRTEKGKTYRKYLIQVEKKWNDPQEIIKRGYQLLHNENLKLKLENSKLKPKALFADTVAGSDTTILIGELAKVLKGNGVDIGEKRLFAWMRKHGYLISRRGSDKNIPTQKAMNLGLFKIKERPIHHDSGKSHLAKTTKVTGKGQEYFIKKFVNFEQIELDNVED